MFAPFAFLATLFGAHLLPSLPAYDATLPLSGLALAVHVDLTDLRHLLDLAALTTRLPGLVPTAYQLPAVSPEVPTEPLLLADVAWSVILPSGEYLGLIAPSYQGHVQ